jgi:SAM-dependent methyltransferase
MTYAEATLKDRSAIKRWFQRRRLHDALACVDRRISPETIIDFGGGNGEFSRHLAARFPRARIFCYEPCSWYIEEARENLADTKGVTLVSAVDRLPKGMCDLLYCNEVFEHFAPVETDAAIDQIQELLSEDGIAVIGVPIEIFVPALLKGVFRMTRRYGSFDARCSTVLRASVGIPPTDRPVGDMGPGLPFHIQHMGFDHRVLRKRLERDFIILRTRTSPAPWLGTFLNNEIYYVLGRADRVSA